LKLYIIGLIEFVIKNKDQKVKVNGSGKKFVLLVECYSFDNIEELQQNIDELISSVWYKCFFSW
jgi:hypothetical protein